MLVGSDRSPISSDLLELFDVINFVRDPGPTLLIVTSLVEFPQPEISLACMVCLEPAKEGWLFKLSSGTPTITDLYRDPIYVPEHKVNRVRGDNETGDFRIATCRLHRAELFDTELRRTPFRRMSGTVYVE